MNALAVRLCLKLRLSMPTEVVLRWKEQYKYTKLVYKAYEALAWGLIAYLRFSVK